MKECYQSLNKNFQQEFPRGIDIVKLHDTLTQIISQLKNETIEYKYTNYIVQLFTHEINGYSFILPRDSVYLKIHSGYMSHCAYSVYRRKHNDKYLIVMVKDSSGKDVATLRFNHQGKKGFFKLESKSDVILISFVEAKLERNNPVSSNEDINRAVVQYFNNLKKHLDNKLTIIIKDVTLHV